MNVFRLLVLTVMALGAGAVQARDTLLNIPLADVLAMPEAKQKLDPSFQFFLAGAKTPKVEKNLGEGVTNQKTNGFGKSDDFGCRWVLLSALIRLQEEGKRNGANAVVDLVSYYKKNETKSDTTLECHAGGILIGAALKGQYAKIN
ncbi:excinuclease ATPase subunit [Inhella gelatinilytica]|uniref:Excinuclease ATPase subunit n=1 Tax=Inhella gelatinilytica TaxID=2795030 RepID=A0A931IV68_9BURK|nr:excinuclease ATPase subunit [Inhella gelatinilytica]MBH9551594.1 excinuclease ATPase subunit [Inhella gelatinilytica]